MIWGAFVSKKKLELVFISKNQCKATNFVELVYDRHLVQFMSKISHAIVMKNSAPLH